MNIGHLVRRSVETVPASTSCAQAARRMRDADVGSVIVAETGRPLGIVTDRDLVVRVIATGADPEKRSVADVMSRKPIFVSQTRDVPHVGVVALDDAILFLSSELAAVAETTRKER